MRSVFNKTVGIACITTFNLLGIQTQNPAIPQTQSSQPSASSGVTSPTSESPDISKPGKPKMDGQAPLVSEMEKTYAALVFPVLRPKLALVSEKASENTPDKASSEAGTGIRVRSWAILPFATGSEAASEVGPKTRIRAAIAEPKLSLKNPSIRFRVNPSESKLSRHPFASPSMELLGPPASFQATAYALRGQTASGVYVRRGVIAADPRFIPLGSVVQIVTPGYSGIYTVQDTGRLIKGNIVDLWMGSYREARIFGRRQIKLHVLHWGKKRRSNK